MTKVMTLKPRISEKAYGLSELLNTYIFEVPTSASKLAVKAAVESQYSVKVSSVNIANSKGKVKRGVRKGRQVLGKRADTKKAYVTLQEGDKLPIFAAIEKTEVPSETSKEKK